LDDPDNNLLQNWLTAFGLENHVTFPTHISGNTLDLVISKRKQTLSVLKVMPGISVSDHTEVIIHVDSEKPQLSRIECNVRKLDLIQQQEFTEELGQLQINLSAMSDPDDVANRYAAGLSSILDKLAPLKNTVITKRPQFPWYSDESIQLKRSLRILERQWLQNKTSKTRMSYTKARNAYSRHLRYNKKVIITEKILECGKDTKKLYALVNNLIGCVSINPMPKVESTSDLPEMFAKFFLSKIEKIRNNLCNVPTYQPRNRQVQPLEHFVEVSQQDIYNILTSIKTKSCELDPIPAKLFKKFTKEFTPIVTHIVNVSIMSSKFPTEWKYSVVKPLLKKPGLPLIEKNYRPVSNLTMISKVTEKAVLNQLTDHFDHKAPLPQYQSAYRTHHSCETALLELHDAILWSLEKQCIMALCTMDLSAAFDTVDHDLLLTVLDNRYGIRLNAKAWIESYL
jgi:hypothetical protein